MSVLTWCESEIGKNEKEDEVEGRVRERREMGVSVLIK